MKFFIYSLLMVAALSSNIGNTVAQAANDKIVPGSVWNDITGRHINAHGGCVIFHEGIYYWFGVRNKKKEKTENKDGKNKSSN